MAKPKWNNTKTNYEQGLFVPKNPMKYIGNLSEIMYRSSWEKHFCYYCDQNTKIKKWACEHIYIPYKDIDGKTHKYYPDFYVELTYDNDVEREERILIEIKPSKEIKPTFINYETGELIPPKKKTMKAYENYEYALKTYAKNMLKWRSAKKWCEDRHMKFILMSEIHLKQGRIL